MRFRAEMRSLSARACRADLAVGTENFRRILDDKRFSDPDPFGTGVIRNTLVFVVIYVIVVTILSTALALMLDAQRRGSGSLRAA